ATVDATAAGEEEQFEAPERGSGEELLDAAAHDEPHALRHSTAHVMAEAVLDLFPGAKLGIGPAITDGFYYDFQLPRALAPGDLEAIEARMAESVAADHPFVRRELSPEEGRAFFVQRDQPFQGETTGGSGSSSTCSASTTSLQARRSGIRRVGPSTARWSRPCASSRPAAATSRSTRRRSSTSGSGSNPATGTSTGTTCSSSSPRT